ncbi:uncharacterized protein LOC121969666 [Zingiber officinale]|uniref:uncharacterized protein LOC121969666 n=1 Tax=Zingiber officinale TaxID=94328 RepID=UPI001C4B4D1C|nr:uncharacterized protein LOC121969666 [Zingiber officinale]
MACGSAFHGTLFVHSVLKSPSSSSKSFFSSASALTVSSGFRRPLRSGSGGVGHKRTLAPSASASFSDDLRPPLGENPEGVISGEWPENFSLLSYDDLRAYLETQIISDETKPSAKLATVMSTQIRKARPEQALEEIEHNFEFVSGLPVVDDELRCIGVISKKDKARAPNGLKSKVGEVMSSPAITLTPDNTVLDAAALMLKMKVHRVPILDVEKRVIGMVTRTDIFQALEAQKVESVS